MYIRFVARQCSSPLLFRFLFFGNSVLVFILLLRSRVRNLGDYLVLKRTAWSFCKTFPSNLSTTAVGISSEVEYQLWRNLSASYPESALKRCKKIFFQIQTISRFWLFYLFKDHFWFNSNLALQQCEKGKKKKKKKKK